MSLEELSPSSVSLDGKEEGKQIFATTFLSCISFSSSFPFILLRRHYNQKHVKVERNIVTPEPKWGKCMFKKDAAERTRLFPWLEREDDTLDERMGRTWGAWVRHERCWRGEKIQSKQRGKSKGKTLKRRPFSSASYRRWEKKDRRDEVRTT